MESNRCCYLGRRRTTLTAVAVLGLFNLIMLWLYLTGNNTQGGRYLGLTWWGDGKGAFRRRLQEYNDAVSAARLSTLSRLSDTPQMHDRQSTYGVIQESDPDFLPKMASLPNVNAVTLPWDHVHLASNMLLTEYYSWAATEKFCSWIRTGAPNRMRYDVTYNHTCSTELGDTLVARATQPALFRLRDDELPEGTAPRYPAHALYLHIITEAFVSRLGGVISGEDKIIPYQCSYPYPPLAIDRNENYPFYREVFVIGQVWGDQFYHRNMEAVPRLAPYRRFLQDAPDVRVMVPAAYERMKLVLDVLGISAERAVHGPLTARVVYLPQSTPCADPLALPTQILSDIYYDYISTKLYPGKRNKVVYIERSKSRKLLQQEEIIQYLKDIVPKYNLKFVTWSDHPVARMEMGMRMFHEAVMVVAPHGAGEANLLFSQPGTIVIEMVCSVPHLNLCYQRTAHVLGQRYYAVPSRTDCGPTGYDDLDVSLEEVKAAVQFYLGRLFI